MAADLPSAEVIMADVRARWGSDVMVSYSRGKDATAVTLALNEAGFRTFGLYFYSIPPDRDGKLLSFEANYLDYAEEVLFGGRRIIRLPSPWLHDALLRGLFQTPERMPVVLAMQRSLRRHSYYDLHNVARHMLDMPDLPVAIGTRASDSPGRRIHFRKAGPVDVARRTFSPIASWGRREVVDIIRRHGVKLPADYSWAPNTFDGVDFRHVVGVAQNRPADFDRIREVFPLIDAETFRAGLIRRRQEGAAP